MMQLKLILVVWLAATITKCMYLFGEENCAVLINEINTGNPEKIKKTDFIELRLQCDEPNPKSVSLQGFKIIGISAEKTSNSQKMYIDLVINLWNSKFNVDTKLLTIGTESVPHTDMNTKSAFVTFRNKFTGNTQSLNMFLNKGDKNVHAIAILYKKDYGFPEFVLSAKQPRVNIDAKMKDLIKAHLVDMIVYSKKSPYEQCEIFSSLHEYSDERYILREFDNAQTDRTLNRCSFDQEPFSPQKFKLGTASPGMENDCSGTHFVLGNHLLELTDALSNEPFEMNVANFDEADNPQCSASHDASTYEHLSDDLIEKQIREETQAAKENECTLLDLGSDVGDVADELDRVNRMKRKLSESENYEEKFEWETTDHFK